MAQKEVEVAGLGIVKLQKRRGNANLRLSIDRSGTIRVTMPPWAPYKAGLAFIEAKRDWLEQQQPQRTKVFETGMRVGKAHSLQIAACEVSTVKSSVRGNLISIEHPHQISADHSSVQSAAQKAIIKALRIEAKSLLPLRTAQLAKKHNFSYSSVAIKHLKARWGSCSNQKDIALNLFLMQLPWHLIDYVILHELIHTKHMNHQADFWQEFTTHLPTARSLAKELRQLQPTIV
jgi:predicted metal-dependent hydrolase